MIKKLLINGLILILISCASGHHKPFEEKMERLVAQLEDQFDESDRLESMIRKSLEILGYGN